MVDFPQLRRTQQRGSKPRCHLLTDGSPDAVAARLTELAKPFATVAPTDTWLPLGFADTNEATLPEASGLLRANTRLALRDWWLSVPDVNTRTPNWDIASTCTIEGTRGLLLVEAKAHDQELIKEESGRKAIAPPVSSSARRNLLRIEWALRDASVALVDRTGLPWTLSRDWNYQMSNRFAWAWKLADLEIPVVLIYLGFLDADEMANIGRPIRNNDTWRTLVKQHSRGLFPDQVWEQRWNCGRCPLIPLIRSVSVPLPSHLGA